MPGISNINPAGDIMKIEIEISERELREQVVSEISNRLINSPYYGKTELQKAVMAAIDTQIMEQLDRVITEEVTRVLHRPIQRYSTFGEPEGTPISLADLMRDGVQQFLTESVNEQGKRSGSQYEKWMTRLEWITKEVAIKELDKEVKTHAAGINAELKKKATQAAAQLLASLKV